MSKTAQRLKTRKAEAHKRYLHGANQAKTQDDTSIMVWYPRCMAWRAGFLQHGGKKFW
jgi:hypothetical protein